jgi:hypothetical protein
MRNLVFAGLVLAGAIVVLAPYMPGAKGARLDATILPHAIAPRALPPASYTRLLPVTSVTDFTVVFEQPGTDGAL